MLPKHSTQIGSNLHFPDEAQSMLFFKGAIIGSKIIVAKSEHYDRSKLVQEGH